MTAGCSLHCVPAVTQRPAAVSIQWSAVAAGLKSLSLLALKREAEEKGHNHPPLVFFWLWRWVVASDARHIIKLFWVVPGGKARGDDSCFLLAPLAQSRVEPDVQNDFYVGLQGNA